MKTERQPHRTPIIGEDVETKEDDIAECFGKLTLDQKSRQSKNSAIRNSETKNVKIAAIKNENNIKVELKDDGEEIKVAATKSSPKKEDIKENEKPKVKKEEIPKVKEEPLGELCPRGPDRKGLATQSRITNSPYSISHPQRNPSLANGGHLIYTPSLTQQAPEIIYPSSIISHAQELPLECYTNHSPPVHNDHGHFIDNIDYPLEVSECPDFQQLALSPAKPEEHCDLDDNTAREIIQNIVNDPIKCHMVCQDLQEHLKETMNVPCEVQNIPESQIDQSPYSSYGSLSPASSPQVVPRLSPYSVSFGSPPGPSSPNIYANTPTFSPNIPSPRGYMSDDSCTHMYPSSTPPMSNPPYFVPDPLNLDDICGEPPEGKRLEEKKLVQELDNTCSQACSTTETGDPPLSLPNSNVSLPTNPVVITTIITAPSPTIRATAISGSQQGKTQYRKILPKPSDDTKPTQQAETFQVQSTSPKQHVSCNGMVHNHRKCVLTAKEEFRARCSPTSLEQTYAKAHTLSDEVISEVDKDGDTVLMVLVCNVPLNKNPEKLYALVERCKEIPQVLCARNKAGQTALCMACLVWHDDPLVAKYIAETMIEVGADLDEPDKTNGSTLIHVLCKQGDMWAKILNELLLLRDQKGKRCFNINKSDYEGMHYEGHNDYFCCLLGRTPLHVAVNTHREESCLQIVKVLLKHGADVGMKDGKQGSTPLHFSVATDKPDPEIVKVLLSATKERKDLVNAMNYKGDTPLHVALAFGDSIEQNTLNIILESLLVYGASRAIRNQNGKAPLELAPESRKVEIKKILDKYNAK